MNISAAALVVIGLCAGGCVAQQTNEMVQATKACALSVYDSPEVAPVRAKTPNDANDVTLAQLSDPAYATTVEIAAVEAANARIKPCQQAFLERLRQLAPSYVPIFVKSIRDGDDEALLLVQRKITWGEYNRRRRDLVVAGSQSLAEEDRRSAANEQARQQALTNSLIGAAAIVEATKPVQPPLATFTSCTQQGAFTNCWQR